MPATARTGEGSPPHFNRTRDNLWPGPGAYGREPGVPSSHDEGAVGGDRGRRRSRGEPGRLPTRVHVRKPVGALGNQSGHRDGRNGCDLEVIAAGAARARRRLREGCMSRRLERLRGRYDRASSVVGVCACVRSKPLMCPGSAEHAPRSGSAARSLGLRQCCRADRRRRTVCNGAPMRTAVAAMKEINDDIAAQWIGRSGW